MSSVSFKSTPARAEQPKYRNKGYIRGQWAYSLAATPVSLVSVPVLKLMKNVSNLSKEDSLQLAKAIPAGLDKSGLGAKGVKTYTITEKPMMKGFVKKLSKLFSSKNDTEAALSELEKSAKQFVTYSKKDEDALNVIKTELQSSKRFQRLSKIPMFNEIKDSIAEIGAKVNGLIFKEGMNAAYFPKANAIITPSKSLRTSIFHEMGHAMNNNGGIILKSLQKMRPMASIVPAIVLADALLNKRKTTDEKLENNSVGNVIQNVRLGVKKHAGLISAAAMLPMVVEEGIASLRGQKLAKGLVKDGILSKDLFKRIKLTNLGGFTTYAATMVGVGLATKVAVDVKDKIQAKYEQKKLAKFQAKQEKIAARKAGK